MKCFHSRLRPLLFFTAYWPLSVFFKQKLGEAFTASSIVIFLSKKGHLASKTESSSTIPSGEAPRIPEPSSHKPVSWIVFPVKLVNALTASASLLTPHCTALTLDKSYSPRSHLRSEGVTLVACRMDPKLLEVSLPLLARCQAGLSRCPTVIWLTKRTSSSMILASEPNRPTVAVYPWWGQTPLSRRFPQLLAQVIWLGEQALGS